MAKKAIASKKVASKKVGLVDLIARAVLDKKFSAQLLKDPDTIAKQFGLSELDTIALQSLSKGVLDDASQRLRMHADWWIGIGFHASFPK